MATARDLIQEAVEKIGAYGAGETMSSADENRCLSVFQNMIDSWSNESLICFAIKEQTLTLVVNQLTYTLGAGGTLPDRPIRLIYGPGAAFATDSNGNRYPIDVYPQDKWNEIWNLTASNSTIPNVIFYDPQYPLGVVKIWPLYAGGLGMTLTFNSYLQLASLNEDPATEIALPPGYREAYVDNLARQIWRYFKPDGAQIPADIAEDAAKSKGVLKRANTRQNIAEFEKALLNRQGAVWNIYADTWR